MTRKETAVKIAFCKDCVSQNAKNARSKLNLHRPPQPNALETCKKIATVIEQRNQGSVELTVDVYVLLPKQFVDTSIADT